MPRSDLSRILACVTTVLILVLIPLHIAHAQAEEPDTLDSEDTGSGKGDPEIEQFRKLEKYFPKAVVTWAKAVAWLGCLTKGDILFSKNQNLTKI